MSVCILIHQTESSMAYMCAYVQYIYIHTVTMPSLKNSGFGTPPANHQLLLSVINQHSRLENPPFWWWLTRKDEIFHGDLLVHRSSTLTKPTKWINLTSFCVRSHGHSLWQHSFDRDIPSSGGISPTPCDDNGIRPILTGKSPWWIQTWNLVNCWGNLGK